MVAYMLAAPIPHAVVIANLLAAVMAVCGGDISRCAWSCRGRPGT
jgi:hypothetical protein